MFVCRHGDCRNYDGISLDSGFYHVPFQRCGIRSLFSIRAGAILLVPPHVDLVYVAGLQQITLTVPTRTGATASDYD